MIGNDVIFPGAAVFYDETGDRYSILDYATTQMKQGTGDWTPAVTYYSNDNLRTYVRDKATFDRKFSLCK